MGRIFGDDSAISLTPLTLWNNGCVTTDDSDDRHDFSSTDPSSASFDQLAARLAHLEEWGWVSQDPSVDQETIDSLRNRVFPDGEDDTAWNNYHWVRSEYDRVASEHFDLGQ